MTRDEWAIVFKGIRKYWPSATFNEDTPRVWYEDLADLNREAVAIAVKAIARDGAQFPPTGGQIRQRAIENATPEALGGDAAFTLALKAVAHFSIALAPQNPGSQIEKGLVWMAERDPLAAEALRRFGYRELALSTDPDSVLRGQFTRAYEEVRTGARKDQVLRSLDAAAADARRGLERPDYRKLAAELEPGDE